MSESRKKGSYYGIGGRACRDGEGELSTKRKQIALCRSSERLLSIIWRHAYDKNKT